MKEEKSSDFYKCFDPVGGCVCAVCIRYAVSSLTTITLFEKMWVNVELSGDNWVPCTLKYLQSEDDVLSEFLDVSEPPICYFQS